ncbi:MAG: hemerythrin domain-containing protein [Candidatus Altiarchaeota archaeon]
MKITKILKEEHKIIEKMLDILEKISENSKIEKEVNYEHLAEIVDFIRTFADKCHHHKEEDLLFPAMERAGIPKEDGPIGVMLTEHEIGRAYVREIASGIEQKDKEKIEKNASSYITLLREHIFKENNILYMMADAHLSDKTQNELFNKFKKFEREEIGEGVHRKYHNLVEKLGKIYLRRNGRNS